MKKLTISLLAIAAVSAPAQIKQTWSTSVYNEAASYMAVDTAVSTFGHSFSLYFAIEGGARITCHDGNGASVWQQEYPTLSSNRGARLVVDSSNDLIFAFQDENSAMHVAKVSGTSGAIIWDLNLPQQTSINWQKLKDLALDGQDNIVLLGMTPSGPVVQKISTNGASLQARLPTSDNGGYQAEDLAVAANGQIYALLASPGFTTRRMEALTPNFSLRYARSWPLLKMNTGSVAADRNGRVCATDMKGNDTIVIRTFSNANGTPTVIESPVAGRYLVGIKAEFDANLHLVIGGTRTENDVHQAFCEWYGVTDTTASLLQRAYGTLPSYGVMQRFFTDAFGQSYIAAAIGAEGIKGTLIAFDENRTTPVWNFEETFGERNANQMAASVGRWGQVALSTTLGDTTTYQGSSYVRQLGLRNLLINGQSFTGGRTISGTVNFYSNDTMDRSVAMTSNTPYAAIAASTVVTAGNSQANMSIELKPTAVRRAVRIEGSFNGAKRSTVFYIEPPVAAGLTLYPTTVKGGGKSNGSARLNGAAPAGGLGVNLSSSDTAAIVPSSVTVAEGAITKAFQVNTTTVSSNTNVVVTATTGSTSKTAMLTITP